MTGINHTTTPIGRSSDQIIDGLLTGIAWNAPTVFYSFPASSGEYSYSGFPNTFARISALQETATHFALNADLGPLASAGFSVEGFTNLNIEHTAATGAHIRLAESDQPNTAWGYYPNTIATGGDVFFGTAFNYRAPGAGNYAWLTLLHEIGHALGLKHGHETATYGRSPADRDSMEFSIMTYRSFIGHVGSNYTNEQWGYAQTYMMADIAALQHMYGADFTSNGGDTVYSWSPNSGDTLIDGEVAIAPGGLRIFATIWDGDGNDTYDLSAYSDDLDIDLNPGGFSVFSQGQIANLGQGNFSRGNIFNALQFQGDARSLIENAIGGSGDDRLVGNAADNVLRGGDGDDVLVGGKGNDDLYGEGGADIFIIELDAGVDRIFDFESSSDHIEFRDGPYSFAQLTIYQDGADTVIKFSGSLLVLVGFDLADIDASDFVFRVYSDENLVGASDVQGKSIVSEIPDEHFLFNTSTADKTADIPVAELLEDVTAFGFNEFDIPDIVANEIWHSTQNGEYGFDLTELEYLPLDDFSHWL